MPAPSGYGAGLDAAGQFKSMTTKTLAQRVGSGLLRLRGAAWRPAFADKIKHPTAVFAGLDKITGRIISFEAAINETVQFGSLDITPRVCFSRPATEAPQTDAFAEVDEVEADKTFKRIFSGWMFADSPGLHGIEHPVYDIWLTDCKGDGPLIHEAPEVADAPPPDAPDSDPNAAAPDPKAAAAAAAAAQAKKKRSRSRPIVDVSARPGHARLAAPAIGRSAPVQPQAPSRRYYPTDSGADPARQCRAVGFAPQRRRRWPNARALSAKS